MKTLSKHDRKNSLRLATATRVLSQPRKRRAAMPTVAKKYRVLTPGGTGSGVYDHLKDAMVEVHRDCRPDNPQQVWVLLYDVRAIPNPRIEVRKAR